MNPLITNDAIVLGILMAILAAPTVAGFRAFIGELLTLNTDKMVGARMMQL